MATVLLTYDVKKTSETVHTDLKKRLMDAYGYSQLIQSTQETTLGKWYFLPNTSLVKSNTTRELASIDFVKACSEVNATWEKFIAAEYTAATFNNQ